MSWDSKVQNLLGHCTSEAAFGGNLTHVPIIGPAQIFKGIWSNTYLSVDPTEGIQVMSSDPNVGIRLSDFAREPRKDDKIIRGSETYFIRSIERDGEGGATLVLEKVDC